MKHGKYWKIKEHQKNINSVYHMPGNKTKKYPYVNALMTIECNHEFDENELPDDCWESVRYFEAKFVNR